jgi:uncharacterized Zn finger protein
MAKKGKGSTAADVPQSGADVRDRFKPLTASDVEQRTDSASYRNGLSYERNDYIEDPVLRGPLLRARCQGQSGGPYTVTATLVPRDAPGADPLAGWSCTCPRGGFCKHIVALLLTWIDAPESVEVRQDVTTLLQDRSREELLAILTGLLKRDPDLDGPIERMLIARSQPAAGGAAGRVTINQDKIQRQVNRILSQAGDEWGAGNEVADELDELLELADSYAAAGQWANAQAVYGLIATAAVEDYEQVEDEEGSLSEVLAAAYEGLRQCVDAQADLPPEARLDPAARRMLFDALFTLWEHTLSFDLDVDEAIPTLLARTATAEEKAEIEQRLRRTLADVPEEAFDNSWRKRPIIAFLAELKGDTLSPEELLAEYRAAGMYQELAAQLITMGRVDDAFAVAKESLSTADQITRFADAVLKADPARREQVLSFVETRLGDAEWTQPARQVREWPHGRQDAYLAAREFAQYREWLEARYIEFGLGEKALAMARRRFEATPGTATYAAVKRAAHLPGKPVDGWPAIRHELIVALLTNAAWRDLISIYLDEQLPGEALEILKRLEMRAPQTTAGTWGSGGYLDMSLVDVEKRVAQAAEADYPEQARDIYRRMAERYIEARGRGNYSAAAELLLRVRELYLRLGQEAAWREYIANLRMQHKSLRALKEELDSRALA